MPQTVPTTQVPNVTFTQTDMLAVIVNQAQVLINVAGAVSRNETQIDTLVVSLMRLVELVRYITPSQPAPPASS